MKMLFRYLLLFFSFTAVNNIFSQDLNFPGTAPSFSLSAHLPSFDLNYLVATKTRIGNHTIKGVDYEPQLLEIFSQILATKKIAAHWQIGAGYGFQRNNPFENNWRNEYRVVQHFLYTVPGSKLKFNNRFRFEERWFSFPNTSGQFSTRARYQAGIVRQINKKIYWQANNEIYAITSGRRNSFISENWVYSGIGFPVKGFGHFETGIGYNSVVRNSDKEWLNLILIQFNWSFILPAKRNIDMHPVMHSRHF